MFFEIVKKKYFYFAIYMHKPDYIVYIPQNIKEEDAELKKSLSLYKITEPEGLKCRRGRRIT
jgi:hypothetical protein